MKRFLTYTAAGAIGTLAHYLVLALGVEVAGIGVPVSTTLGFFVGAVVNYQLNRRVTFRASQPAPYAFARFLLIAIAGMILNLVVVMAILAFIPVHYFIAQLVATALVLLFGYTANAIWTFRDLSRNREGQSSS